MMNFINRSVSYSTAPSCHAFSVLKQRNTTSTSLGSKRREPAPLFSVFATLTVPKIAPGALRVRLTSVGIGAVSLLLYKVVFFLVDFFSDYSSFTFSPFALPLEPPSLNSHVMASFSVSTTTEAKLLKLVDDGMLQSQVLLQWRAAAG